MDVVFYRLIFAARLRCLSLASVDVKSGGILRLFKICDAFYGQVDAIVQIVARFAITI